MAWLRTLLISFPVVLPLACGAGNYDESSDPRFAPYLAAVIKADCEPDEGGAKRMRLRLSGELRKATFYCRDEPGWGCGGRATNPAECTGQPGPDTGPSWSTVTLRENVSATVLDIRTCSSGETGTDVCVPATMTTEADGSLTLTSPAQPWFVRIRVRLFDVESGLVREVEEPQYPCSTVNAPDDAGTGDAFEGGTDAQSD
jgi:hypothetical protein